VTAEQHAHLDRLIAAFGAECREKYERGQPEHGGNLWDRTDLLDQAIAEAIDLVVYLFTLREQRHTEGEP